MRFSHRFRSSPLAALLVGGFIALALPAMAEPSSSPAAGTSGTTSRALADDTAAEVKPEAKPANTGEAKPATPGETKAVAKPDPKPASADSSKPEAKDNAAASEPSKPAENAAAPGPDAKPEAEAPKAEAGSKILINIDKSTQEMTVFVDGIEKYTWPVSTGKRGYSTPSGDYTPTSMNKIWYSKEWDNAPMPHAIFYMKDGHAIHGTQEVKNLGRPASHGCVRLAPKNASTLFDLVEKNGMSNTQVVLTGVTPGGEAKVADQEPVDQYPNYGAYPWPGQRGYGYYPPPRQYYQPQQRRRIFGGFFGPPQGYYRQPRGYYPRGY